MAEFFPALDAKHEALLAAAPVYFVATAPKNGRINLSPKGMDTLRVISPTQIAYLDLSGSGNETAAHLLDDGRITLMVCSFDRAAMILRLYGKGRSVQPADAEWAALVARFPALAGTRQIIVVALDSVQTSCGYAVPVMDVVRERDTLRKYAAGLGEEVLLEKRARNLRSIDGLPTGLTNYREPQG